LKKTVFKKAAAAKGQEKEGNIKNTAQGPGPAIHSWPAHQGKSYMENQVS
jgi:hypothetical protein